MELAWNFRSENSNIQVTQKDLGQVRHGISVIFQMQIELWTPAMPHNGWVFNNHKFICWNCRCPLFSSGSSSCSRCCNNWSRFSVTTRIICFEERFQFKSLSVYSLNAILSTRTWCFSHWFRMRCADSYQVKTWNKCRNSISLRHSMHITGEFKNAIHMAYVSPGNQ